MRTGEGGGGVGNGGRVIGKGTQHGSGGGDRSVESVVETLRGLGSEVQEQFSANKRVLSFSEYAALLCSAPHRHLRNSAQYLRDMFDHYGVTQVAHAAGEVRRFKLFDAPWDDTCAGLIGQEGVQNRIYGILNNFVRQRRVDRFILLHGPNGSSKSTISDVLAQGMEHYSGLDDGALYRFSWIFPSQAVDKSGIGFGEVGKGRSAQVESYAHLDGTDVDARVACDLCEHPVLLLPVAVRQKFFESLALGGETDGFALSDYVRNGDLCPKCKEIFEALLSAYNGDFVRVLRHVQVERFYVSRRYGVATARVEPRIAVDARMRQVTADRSLAALPAALHSVALHDLEGELVRANRGLIDFADLFKRPLEAYKYLLSTVEDGQVGLEHASVFVDLVFMGSANESLLNAFMESAEWNSFKARMELVRVPYLTDYRLEQRIYDHQVRVESLAKPVAPHVAAVAGWWAVLTRMHRPDPSRYEDEALREVVSKLAPADKARLYAEGRVPDSFSDEEKRRLRAGVKRIATESQAGLVYEGRTGASPREIKTVLLNAAHGDRFECLTPEAVLVEIEALVKQASVYDYLRQEVRGLGYYDHAGFVQSVREWWLDRVDDEVRAAMGLVEESSYGALFDRYVNHVTHYVRKEKVRNDVTGKFEETNAKLMREVEEKLDVSEGDVETFRQGMMTRIGAWSLENEGEKPEYRRVFAEHIQRLKDCYFKQEYSRVHEILKQAMQVLSNEGASVSDEAVAVVREMLARLDERYGYCEPCAREAISSLLRYRYNA